MLIKHKYTYINKLYNRVGYPYNYRYRANGSSADTNLTVPTKAYVVRMGTSDSNFDSASSVTCGEES